MFVLSLLAYSNIRGLGFLVLLSMAGFPIFLPRQMHSQIDSKPDCQWDDLTRISLGDGIFLAATFVAPGLFIIVCNLFGVFHSGLSSALELSFVFGVVTFTLGALAVAIYRRKTLLKSDGGNYGMGVSDFLFLFGCLVLGGFLVAQQSELSLSFSWGAGSIGFVFGLIGLIIERGIRNHENALLAAPVKEEQDKVSCFVENEKERDSNHLSVFKKIRTPIFFVFISGVVFVLTTMEHIPSYHDWFLLAVCFLLFLTFDIFASIATGEQKQKFRTVLRKKEPATFFFVSFKKWTVARLDFLGNRQLAEIKKLLKLQRMFGIDRACHSLLPNAKFNRKP